MKSDEKNVDENENNEENLKAEVEKPNLPKELEKIQAEKIRGRVIIFDIKNSEFAKHLGLQKSGDYTQKAK